MVCIFVLETPLSTFTGFLAMDTKYLTEDVMSMIDKESFCNKQHIVFPVHYNNNHWTLMEANFLTRKFVHYDGCAGVKCNFYGKVAASFIETVYTKLSHVRNAEKVQRWKISNYSKYPTQIGGDDCGVFLLHGAASIAFANSNFNWEMADVPYLRKYYGGVIQGFKRQISIDFHHVFTTTNANTQHTRVEKEPPKVIPFITPKISTPEKRNKMAKIYKSLADYNQQDLAKKLETYPLVDLIAWGVLTRVKEVEKSTTHIDYRKHIEWIVDNIDHWPEVILETIPQLRQEYFHLILQWDYCYATGNARTDLGMALLCITLKCCTKMCPCILSLTHKIVQDQKNWKGISKKE